MSNKLEYRILLTKQAKKLLKEIKYRREQDLILKRLEKLKYEPEKQGKVLTKELKGWETLDELILIAEYSFETEYQDQIIHLPIPKIS